MFETHGRHVLTVPTQTGVGCLSVDLFAKQLGFPPCMFTVLTHQELSLCLLTYVGLLHEASPASTGLVHQGG